MHIEILQSPWLCELMAFHINLRESKVESSKGSALFEGCNLTYNDDGQPSLTCELFDSVKVDIDLTCSICLVSSFPYACFRRMTGIKLKLIRNNKFNYLTNILTLALH